MSVFFMISVGKMMNQNHEFLSCIACPAYEAFTFSLVSALADPLYFTDTAAFLSMNSGPLTFPFRYLADEAAILALFSGSRLPVNFPIQQPCRRSCFLVICHPQLSCPDIEQTKLPYWFCSYPRITGFLLSLCRISCT